MGCKHGEVTQSDNTHNNLRVSYKTLPKDKNSRSGGKINELTLMIA